MEVYIVMLHVKGDFDYVDAVFDSLGKATNYVRVQDESKVHYLEIEKHSVS